MEKTLKVNNLNDLYSSGLTDETIKNLGFYSGTAAEIEAILGFGAGPGLIIPYPGTGDKPFCRVKPDSPLTVDGGLAKYLSPKGALVRAYIPPRTREKLKDLKNSVIITEGEKKSAKADQEGVACIGLAGIWGFSQHHQLIPDLSEISWHKRVVYIAPDSDYHSNPDIKLAVFTLERWLAKLGGSIQ